MHGLSEHSVFRHVAGPELSVVDDPGKIRAALHST